MERYLNLAIGAKRRLEILRSNAAPNASAWRKVRYATFVSHDGLAHGLNGKSPIWHAFGPVFNRQTWCDEVAEARIGHTGWFVDNFQDNKYRGFVIALPHGRFLSGYVCSDSGEHVYFSDLFDDAKEAARFADGRAEWYAGEEREYQERWQEAQDLNEALSEAFTRLRECLVLRHKKCMTYVRDEIGELTDSIRTMRAKLATDFADIEI